MRKSKWLLLPAVAILAVPGFAAEPAQPRYNVVEFQAEARREVQNDLLNATLYVELSDADAAALANAVNKSVNAALRVARDYPNVRASSGSSRTFPVYSKGNVLQGWRGRAEIRIESRDFEAASRLIAKLQANMQLATIGFSVSPEFRRAVEDELTVEAIRAFKVRAEILKAALTGRSYRLVRLSVAAGHQGPQPRFAMARAASAAQEVTPPDLEAGISLVIVVANGAIEVVE